MWYLSVFVPASEAVTAAVIAAAVWPDDPSAQLSVALVDETGGSWVGGNAAVTDTEIAALQGLGSVSGVRYYRYGVGADRALGTAYPPGPAEGTAWGWAQSLEAAGLSVV